MTTKILVDACGWVGIIDSGINIDMELSKLFGNYELILIEQVKEELIELEKTLPKSKRLMLNLLEQKSTDIKTQYAHTKHTDDILLEYAKANNTPILSVDTALKKRFFEHGLLVIEIVKNKYLRVIEDV